MFFKPHYVRDHCRVELLGYCSTKLTSVFTVHCTSAVGQFSTAIPRQLHSEVIAHRMMSKKNYYVITAEWSCLGIAVLNWPQCTLYTVHQLLVSLVLRYPGNSTLQCSRTEWRFKNKNVTSICHYSRDVCSICLVPPHDQNCLWQKVVMYTGFN